MRGGAPRDSGAPWAPGVSTRVTRSGNRFIVVSYPHPVHWGVVSWNVALCRWIATVKTFHADNAFRRSEQQEALQWLATAIGARYRTDMRRRFTGPQVRAMGMGQCPAHRPCRDLGACPIERADHAHLCKQSPANPYTVFCDDHAGGAT